METCNSDRNSIVKVIKGEKKKSNRVFRLQQAGVPYSHVSRRSSSKRVRCTCKLGNNVTCGSSYRGGRVFPGNHAQRATDSLRFRTRAPHLSHPQTFPFSTHTCHPRTLLFLLSHSLSLHQKTNRLPFVQEEDWSWTSSPHSA